MPNLRVDELVTAVQQQNSEGIKNILTPLLEEMKVMGLALHTNHTNVGSALRVKEWSGCRYTFCKRRYELVFGESSK